MKRQLPHGGKRLEDRVARQLVAKGEPIAVDAEHARRDAVSEARGIAPRDLREEPHLAVSADDSGGITVVFLGRRRVAGIVLGAVLTVDGMVCVHQRRLAILNPAHRERR